MQRRPGSQAGLDVSDTSPVAPELPPFLAGVSLQLQRQAVWRPLRLKSSASEETGQESFCWASIFREPSLCGAKGWHACLSLWEWPGHFLWEEAP